VSASGRRQCRACEREAHRKGRLYGAWEKSRAVLYPDWPERKPAILADLGQGISRAVLKQRYGVSLQVLRSLDAERRGELPPPKTPQEKRWEKINRFLRTRSKMNG